MILSVTSTMPAHSRGFVWFAFDVPTCADLDAVHAELKASGMIRGDRIDTMVFNGARRVVRRTPSVITLALISALTPLRVEIIDENGEVLA